MKGRLSKVSLQAALDAADAAAHAKATAVVMRESSWLQSLGLPYEVQQMVGSKRPRLLFTLLPDPKAQWDLRPILDLQNLTSS